MRRCADTKPDGSFVGAMSDDTINWITICPRSFSNYRAVAPLDKDQNVSANRIWIGLLRPLGVTIFHEMMHILYPGFSK